LHENLQKYADLYLKYANLLAEHQLQIGMLADGQTSTVVQLANRPQFLGNPLSDRQVLDVMTERIYTVAKRIWT
jgi:starvation-inducible DNA-binding protein